MKTKRKMTAREAMAMCIGFHGDWTAERIREEWFESRDSERSRKNTEAESLIEQLRKFGFSVTPTTRPSKRKAGRNG